jgi:hypothetical protein
MAGDGWHEKSYCSARARPPPPDSIPAGGNHTRFGLNEPVPRRRIPVGQCVSSPSLEAVIGNGAGLWLELARKSARIVSILVWTRLQAAVL